MEKKTNNEMGTRHAQELGYSRLILRATLNPKPNPYLRPPKLKLVEFQIGVSGVRISGFWGFWLLFQGFIPKP